jgi:hypothetical protein
VKENMAIIPGLKSSEEEELKTGFLKDKGLKERNVSLCSLWGPCLGERADYRKKMEVLKESLSNLLTNDFKVGIAGCGKDCRDLFETSDLLILIDDSFENLTLLIGSRTRPFQKPILPRPWKTFQTEDIVNFITDVSVIFDDLKVNHQTFPEYASNLTIKRLNKIFFGGVS